MAKMATATPSTKAATQPRWLRWHPARLLYLFIVTLVVGVVYSEVQALLEDPASALDPSQLRKTLFWKAALAYPLYFGAACVLAVGAAVLGWRLDRRYAAQQQERQLAAVVRRVRAEGVPAATRPAIPRDLPPRTPGFVGRQQDLSDISAALRLGQAVAIVGMGGLGKSSLAAEAMHRLAVEPGAFPGGVTWARCDERVGPVGLLWIEDQLLAAWGASLPAETTARAATPEEGIELRERALRGRLGALEGEAQPSAKLALLDSIEPGLPHVRLLDMLGSLGVATLVTTRVEPSSQRVRLLNLDVLDAEAGARLFAERYSDRGGVWEAARDEAAAKQIAEALGGLPLAIELAAARAARTRTPLPALAEELRAPDALARLSDPIDPGAGVRYSLRKTLLALSPTQRSRFAALGLPEGPDWPVPVIERMLTGALPVAASARSDLEALTAYSLVGLVAPRGEETARVRMHPLVRELAREEFTGQPEDVQVATLAALVSSVGDWVTQARSAQRGLAGDEDLIAGALRAAVARRVALPQVIAIVRDGSDHLLTRGTTLLAEMYALALESARAIGDRQGELAALAGQGQMYFYMGRMEESLRDYRAAMGIARDVGDQAQLFNLLGRVGANATQLGRAEEAERLYQEGRALAGALGARLDARAMNSFGNLAFVLGHLEEAGRWFQQARAAARSSGDALTDAMAAHNVGLVAQATGDDAAARRAFEEALAITREHGNPVGAGIQLNHLAELALKAGDLEAASRYFLEALPLLERNGAPSLAQAVRGSLAEVAAEDARSRGDVEAAERSYREALRLFEGLGGAVDSARAIQHIQERMATLGRHPGASAPSPAAE